MRTILPIPAVAVAHLTVKPGPLACVAVNPSFATLRFRRTGIVSAARLKALGETRTDV